MCMSDVLEDSIPHNHQLPILPAHFVLDLCAVYRARHVKETTVVTVL